MTPFPDTHTHIRTHTHTHTHKVDPKKHLEQHVEDSMTSNIAQCLGAMVNTVAF